MENCLTPDVRRRLAVDGMLTPSPSPRSSREDVRNGLTFTAHSPRPRRSIGDFDNLNNAIELPLRYVPKTAKSKSSIKQNIPMDISSREEDLQTAIDWLRREMLIMKRQDQTLLRRLLDLRSAVVNLRCNQSNSSLFDSASDVSSMDGSFTALDDRNHNKLSTSPQFYTEFRGRTMSMLTPRNSLVWRVKPRSKESF